MADQDPKFEPLAGQTYVLKFLYDKPKTGSGNYGPWQLYKFDVWETVADFKAKKQPRTMAWFMPDKAHFAIEEHRKTNPFKNDVCLLEVGQQRSKAGKPYNTYLFKFNINGETITYDSEDFFTMQHPKEEPPVNNNPDFEQIRRLMSQCLKASWDCYAENDFGEFTFTMEDVRQTASSLFIQCAKAGVYDSGARGEAPDQPPPPDDSDMPPMDDEDDLPF